MSIEFTKGVINDRHNNLTACWQEFYQSHDRHTDTAGQKYIYRNLQDSNRACRGRRTQLYLAYIPTHSYSLCTSQNI